MKNIILIFLSFITGFSQLRAQKDTSKIKLNISGFVNTQLLYDSRQIVGGRENQLLLYPSNILPDNNGNDINARPSYNQLSMMSRVAASVTGPSTFGAKTSAWLEGDFTGVSNSDNNGFRLRHAWIKLSWESRELLIGQYWSPINGPEAIPEVLSLNTGAPFRPFSRSPQIRFTQSFSNFKFIAAAVSQRDYTSDGPDGASATYLRNAVLPNIHGQLQYRYKSLLLGAGFDYKQIEPRTKDLNGNITHQKQASKAVMVFSNYKTNKLDVKAQLVWGENLSDHMMTGGYWELSDTVSKSYSYKNCIISSFWIDATYFIMNWKLGLFTGYLKNMDYSHETPGKFYGKGDDIEYLYRIAPRLVYAPGKLSFSTECEYTVAAYDQTLNKIIRGKSKEVGNTRLVFGITYQF